MNPSETRQISVAKPPINGYTRYEILFLLVGQERDLMSERGRNSANDLDTRISLIQSAKQNEPEAWQAISELYSPLIAYWARKKGVECPHEQENIVQEVLRRVFHRLDTFTKEENKGTFRGWLRTITNNFIYSNQLGQNRLKSVGGSNWQNFLDSIAQDEPSVCSLLDSVSEDGQVSIEDGLLFRQIMNWVNNEYTSTQADAFKRVVIDQRPAREVADELNISVNVVYQTKCRILARIREVFTDLV